MVLDMVCMRGGVSRAIGTLFRDLAPLTLHYCFRYYFSGILETIALVVIREDTGSWYQIILAPIYRIHACHLVHHLCALPVTSEFSATHCSHNRIMSIYRYRRRPKGPHV